MLSDRARNGLNAFVLVVIAFVFYARLTLTQTFVIDDWYFLSWFSAHTPSQTLEIWRDLILGSSYFRPFQSLYMFIAYHGFGFNALPYLVLNGALNILNAFLVIKICEQWTGEKFIASLVGITYLASFHILEDTLFSADVSNYTLAPLFFYLTVLSTLRGRNRRSALFYTLSLFFNESVWLTPFVCAALKRSLGSDWRRSFNTPMLIIFGTYSLGRWLHIGIPDPDSTAPLWARFVKLVPFADYLSQSFNPVKRPLAYAAMDIPAVRDTVGYLRHGLGWIWRGPLGLAATLLFLMFTLRYARRFLFAGSVWILLMCLPFLASSPSYSQTRFVLLALCPFLVIMFCALRGFFGQLRINERHIPAALGIFTAVNALLMLASFQMHLKNESFSKPWFHTDLKPLRAKTVKAVWGLLLNNHASVPKNSVFIFENVSLRSFHGTLLPIAIYRDPSLRAHSSTFLTFDGERFWIRGDGIRWNHKFPRTGRSENVLSVAPEQLYYFVNQNGVLKEIRVDGDFFKRFRNHHGILPAHDPVGLEQESG